ncbi:Sec62/63 complex, subunit Sec66 [Cunninghamella echinulata]|nr:Sec62/63 complex, subunit Sec66 [Cunninghamella echinulata]
MDSSLLLPALYLGGCIAAMTIFSHFYRKLNAIKQVEPWFPENVVKEEYIALLNSETSVPEHHLKAALLRRAMEAVRRLVQVQQEKPALQQLMRMGSIGDELWTEFTVAEQEIMTELQTIAAEANTFKENWGQTIFSTAAQMLEHEKQKELQKEMVQLRDLEEKKRLAQEKRDQKENQQLQKDEHDRKLKDAEKAQQELLNMEEKEKKGKGKGKK